MANVRLTHSDAVITGQSMSFAVLVAALIQVGSHASCCACRQRGATALASNSYAHAGAHGERPTYARASPSMLTWARACGRRRCVGRSR